MWWYKSRILKIKMLEVMQLPVHMVGRQTTEGKNCGQLKIMVLWKPEHDMKDAASFLQGELS